MSLLYSNNMHYDYTCFYTNTDNHFIYLCYKTFIKQSNPIRRYEYYRVYFSQFSNKYFHNIKSKINERIF